MCFAGTGLFRTGKRVSMENNDTVFYSVKMAVERGVEKNNAHTN